MNHSPPICTSGQINRSTMLVVIVASAVRSKCMAPDANMASIGGHCLDSGFTTFPCYEPTQARRRGCSKAKSVHVKER